MRIVQDRTGHEWTGVGRTGQDRIAHDWSGKVRTVNSLPQQQENNLNRIGFVSHCNQLTWNFENIENTGVYRKLGKRKIKMIHDYVMLCLL